MADRSPSRDSGYLSNIVPGNDPDNPDNPRNRMQVEQPLQSLIDFEFDPETVHYHSFSLDVFSPDMINNAILVNVFMHPNRNFNRELASEMFLFNRGIHNHQSDNYDPEAANPIRDKVRERECTKLWIFEEQPTDAWEGEPPEALLNVPNDRLDRRQPLKALMIHNGEVFFYGRMYNHPHHHPYNHTEDWSRIDNNFRPRTEIIGFASGDNHTVTYTEREAIIWGQNTHGQVRDDSNNFNTVYHPQRRLTRQNIILLHNKDDRFVKAVCSRYRTLLLTQQGKLYGSMTTFARSDSGELKIRVGSLADVFSEIRYMRDFGDNRGLVSTRDPITSNFRIIDVACTMHAFFVLLLDTRDKIRVAPQNRSTDDCLNMDGIFVGRNQRFGKVYGWGSKANYVLGDADDGHVGHVRRPTRIPYLERDIVKIAGASTYLLALGRDQNLYAWGTIPGIANIHNRENLITLTDLRTPETHHTMTVINIAAVYSTNVSAVLVKNVSTGNIDRHSPYHIYVLGDLLTIQNVVDLNAAFGLLYPTRLSSMQEVFLRCAQHGQSRTYQTATFENEDIPPQAGPSRPQSGPAVKVKVKPSTSKKEVLKRGASQDEGIKTRKSKLKKANTV